MPAKPKITKKKFTYKTNSKRNRRQIKSIIDSFPELLDNYDKRTLRRRLKDPNIVVRGGFLQPTDVLTDDEGESVTQEEELPQEEKKGATECPNAIDEISEASSGTLNAFMEMCDDSVEKLAEIKSPWSPLAERLPSSCSDDHDTFNDSFLRRDQHGHMVDADGVVYISDDE
jgi:hypothetical protein